jgi:hypothetical protein
MGLLLGQVVIREAWIKFSVLSESNDCYHKPKVRYYRPGHQPFDIGWRREPAFDETLMTGTLADKQGYPLDGR